MSRASFRPSVLAPKPVKVHGVHMNLPQSLHQEVKALCAYRGLNFTQLVEGLLVGWKDKQTKKKGGGK